MYEIVNPLTQEMKDKWVAALRSGKYQQGQHELKSCTDKFCCLGVLCDVKGLPYGDGFFQLDESTHVDTCLVKRICVMDGPSIVIHGPAIDKAFYVSNVIQEQLVTMNDDGVSFNEIADWIEKNVKVEN